MSNENELHKRTVKFVIGFGSRFWSKALDAFFGWLVALVVAGGLALSAYLFGAQDSKEQRWTHSSLGHHCIGRALLDIRESSPHLVADQKELAHLLACHGAIGSIEGTDEHLIGRIEKIFGDECFTRIGGKLALDLTKPGVEVVENTKGQPLAACSCQAGHSRLIATHAKSWCSAELPDPSLFQSLQ